MSLLTNIISYWKLDGNSNDATANANDGTDNGITYSNANGKINQGAGFDGSTSKIDVGTTNLPTGVTDRTITAWVNPVAETFYGPIFDYGTATGSQGFYWSYSASTKK